MVGHCARRQPLFVPTTAFAVAAGWMGAVASEIKFTAAANSIPHLVIQSNEPEDDATLRAPRRKAEMIGLRLGTLFNVGSGNGSAVSLNLKIGATTAKVSGVSLPSADFPTTEASELFAEVATGDPILSVLSSGDSIRFSGSIMSAQSATPGAAATKSLERFLVDCAGQR
jgi:hypothetical protein